MKSNLYISEKNYKNGPFSFNPSTFELDGLEVLDSYEENGNIYVIIGGIPLTTKQDDDIREEVRQIILNTEAVNKLNRDSLEKILAVSQPKDIINLCQTNEKFKNVCNDVTNLFEMFTDETEDGKEFQDMDFLKNDDGYLSKFNKFLKQLGVKMPFTKENLREQALKNEMLYLYPSDTFHSQYQIIELTI